MNFELSDDQKMLVDTAASFVKRRSAVERARKLRQSELGYEPRVWKEMGELGWLGIPFSEDVGGYGGRFLDAALVIEQLGTTLVPEPYLSSVVLGGMALSRAGTAEQQRRWLAPMIAGETTLALAYGERDGRYDLTRMATRAEAAGGGRFRLDGEKVWVLGGHAADLLLVAARSGGRPGEIDGLSLFAVERGAPGVTIESVQTLDGRRAASVRLRGVEVAAEGVLGPVGQAYPVLEWVVDCGAAAACAEAVGLCSAVLQMTVAYLKTREQFGTVIGRFQALQHRAVDMFVEVELLRSAALEASIRIDEGAESARRAAVSAAKVQLSTGGRQVTAQAIQLHGGIGCTDEHDVGLYFKRMQVLASLFGDEEFHVTRYARLPEFEIG